MRTRQLVRYLGRNLMAALGGFKPPPAGSEPAMLSIYTTGHWYLGEDLHTLATCGRMGPTWELENPCTLASSRAGSIAPSG